jgi:general secretion pathway protein H
VNRRARGFTLIELAVVLLIVGLALGLVGPSIGRATDTIRARADVAAVAAFLRHAREQAIAKREVHRVQVDPDGQGLLLTSGDSETVKASREVRSSTRLAREPRDASAVTFLPEGRSSGGAFLVEGAGRLLYRVRVDPLSGRVSNRRVES